jgi:plastocyanin
MTTSRFAALLAALAVGGVGLGACGDGDQRAAPEPAATEPSGTEPSGGAPAPADETVEVAADPSGQLKFVQSSLTASAGKATFEFTNEASVPHDFTIEQDAKKIAGTKVITQKSETLTADLEAGEYAYYCSVAGHREAGMQGTLTVE